MLARLRLRACRSVGKAPVPSRRPCAHRSRTSDTAGIDPLPAGRALALQALDAASLRTDAEYGAGSLTPYAAATHGGALNGRRVTHVCGAARGVQALVKAIRASLDRTGLDGAAMRVTSVSAQCTAIGPLAAPKLAIVEARGLAPIAEREAGWLATHHVSTVELTKLRASALAASGIASGRGWRAGPASK